MLLVSDSQMETIIENWKKRFWSLGLYKKYLNALKA